MSAEEDALRRRVAELEAELSETARRTNAAIARAEERAARSERWEVRLRAGREGLARLGRVRRLPDAVRAGRRRPRP